MHDYQGALKDFDTFDVFEPRNAFTLQIHGGVKRMLNDYQGTLEELRRVDVLDKTMQFLLQLVKM